MNIRLEVFDGGFAYDLIAEIFDLPFDQVRGVELLCDTGEAQLGCATSGQA
jgi:hypothetical protein